MISKAKHILTLWRHFGTSWLLFRLRYHLKLQTGGMKRALPPVGWDEQPLGRFLTEPRLEDPEIYLRYRSEEAPRFFFASEQRPVCQPFFARWDASDSNHSQASVRARQIVDGTFTFFDHLKLPLGFPPNWHQNPLDGKEIPADRHWSTIPDFGQGDIKLVWEPSRFAFAYPLVRAYWRTGDESFAEAFWQLVEDWRRQNPPQQGANWKCGQEISFRVMAWCFGLYGFQGAAASTPERILALAQMIAISGHRVRANIAYALSQRNNHGMSEAVGLFTIGVLFPEFKFSREWLQIGRKALITQAEKLIYEDGSFSQHSVNYHRVMLHDYLWGLRLAELAGEPFGADTYERIEKAADFLYGIQDEFTGKVPNYGQNDGALVLPLNNCAYDDYRPAVQAARFLCRKTRTYEAGPWDEDLLWLFGPEAVDVPLHQPEHEDLSATVGGYYTLRSLSGFAFTRCGTFRDRPGQADTLHVDLWWRGTNMAMDAGTYSYNAPAPWNNPFAHTAYHNTVTVDGLDQMERVGKFLWLPWLHGKFLADQKSNESTIQRLTGEHDGYARLRHPVTHRRSLFRLQNETWVIADRLMSSATHHYRLHWLLPDYGHTWDESTGTMELKTGKGPYWVRLLASPGARGVYSLVRADTQSPRGWHAPCYNSREPALSIDLTAAGSDVEFFSLFGPEPCTLVINGSEATVRAAQWQESIKID